MRRKHCLIFRNYSTNIFIFGLLKLCIWKQIFGKRFEGSEQYQLFTEQFRSDHTRFEKSGDRGKCEPGRGFSFAPGGSEEWLYAINHNLYPLKNLL